MAASFACGGSVDASEAERRFVEAERLRASYQREASLQAVEHYRVALEGWAWSGDAEAAAIAARQLGITLEQLGEPGQALGAYERGVALAAAAPNAALAAELHGAAGVVGALTGNDAYAWAQAEDHCDLASELAEATAATGAAAAALTCYAEVAYARGDLAGALELHTRAEPMWRASGSNERLAKSLLFQGYVQSDLSRLESALAAYNRSLELYEDLGDAHGVASTQVAAARLRLRRGEYQEALTGFEPACDFFARIEDPVSEASCLTGIASVYLELGQYRRALRNGRDAIELFDAVGLSNYSVDVLNLLGDAHLGLDEPEQALRVLNRGLELSEESGNRRWQAYSLRYLADAHQRLGDRASAVQYLQRALRLDELSEDPRLHAEVLVDLGRAYADMEDHDSALVHFTRALRLNRESGDRLAKAESLVWLARAHRDSGDLDRGRARAEEAIQVAESLRAEVVSQDMRVSYLASVHDYYRLWVDLLMRLHDARPEEGFDAAAFEASERARARSLLEDLALAGIDLHEGVDPELLADERRLRTSLSEGYALQAGLGGDPAGVDKRDDLDARVAQLEEEYELARARVRAASPRYSALAERHPLTLGQVRDRVLDDDSVLLAYSLGQERSVLWVVSRTGLWSYQLPPREEIETLTLRAYELVTAPSNRAPGESRARLREAAAEYWMVARELSDTLLAPATPQIQGKRILVVTEGILQTLPFGALPLPGHPGDPTPLIAAHEVVNLPSASAVALLRERSEDRRGAGSGVAVVADPVYAVDDSRFESTSSSPEGTVAARIRGVPTELDLSSETPFRESLRAAGILRDGELYLPRLAATAAEATRIAASAGEQGAWTATGFHASRATVLGGRLSDHQIVHFATHGLFNDGDPALSGLILSMFDESGAPRDGFLRLHEIYNLNLAAELVVLSACSTALGERIEGEGLVGIVRGFMYAGAERVVASLWKVDDIATGELMSRFYRELLENERAPSAALRHAQLSMWEEEKWRQPFYWAAFVLQGDWEGF